MHYLGIYSSFNINNGQIFQGGVELGVDLSVLLSRATHRAADKYTPTDF